MGGGAIGAGGGIAAADSFACMRTVRWDAGRVVMIDQTGLPAELVFAGYGDYRQAAGAIRRLVVRGAPAMGMFGAFGLELAARRSGAPSAAGVVRDLEEAAAVLVATRPTAVNLKWAVDRVTAGRKTAPDGAGVINPAFDETPPALVSDVITDAGAAEPPYKESMPGLFKANF